ncbi:anti-sigma factor family protein [Polyangium sorediatum]|uniref:Zf-HC2 domain-containing protein n=1 Tax=Polyangium sorediatum TaxID=889274 RepID=A0ABT6NNG2_9BACT|nr:zf-HC2 domain-containing protein [Polyangium sorediatum]MDI1429844.1 zf-HC2 domain-containing protein [Polyangium sorediatum]
MSHECSTEDEFIALLDGQATENRAAALRAHIAGCARCQKALAALEALTRALAAPVHGAPSPDAVAKIMRRIEVEPPAHAPAKRGARRLPWAPLGALAAAAAVAAFWIGARAMSHDAGLFTARGGVASASLQRDVGIFIHRAGERLEPLAAAEVVTKDTAYAVSYVNLGPAGSAFLLVFAVDAAGEVHWIQPAYLDAADDPGAIALEHAETDAPLPTAAVLDAPAPGPLRLVSIVCPRSLHVSQIESLVPSALDLASLRARFPGAVIQELTVSLNPPGSP